MQAILHSLIEQGYTKEQAKLGLSKWDIRPLVCADKQVGEVMLRNNEVHFAIDKTERLKLGRTKLIKNTINALLEEKTFLVTRLFKNDKHRKLIELIGFEHTHSDDKTDYFWLNRGEA